MTANRKARTDDATVLIVEDEWMIREDIAAAFEDDGWVVQTAGSGEEALLMLTQPAAIDLVFTDIQLPGRIDGWDVGDACAAGDVPVLYTSGESQNQVEDSRFFPKPYDPVSVAEAGRHLLRN
jgi:CheY-like chemotaxis protein